MNYGRNQQALLDFLHKHPNQWHRIKRRKAIDAAKTLTHRINTGVQTLSINKSKWFYVSLEMPQMLIEQN